MINQKFKKLDEGFICEFCGKVVLPLKYTSRDHCPFCLYSKHVDINPGDRMNTCKGLLKPIELEQNNQQYTIVYKCEKCNKFHKNKTANDDNFELLLSLSNHTINEMLPKLKKKNN